MDEAIHQPLDIYFDFYPQSGTTGQLRGEGFDCRQLSKLFLTTPIKFDGQLLQYLGRVLHPALGKDKAKVYDYVDFRG